MGNEEIICRKDERMPMQHRQWFTDNYGSRHHLGIIQVYINCYLPIWSVYYLSLP